MSKSNSSKQKEVGATEKVDSKSSSGTKKSKPTAQEAKSKVDEDAKNNLDDSKKVKPEVAEETAPRKVVMKDLTEEEFLTLKSRKGLYYLLKSKGINYDKTLDKVKYDDELEKLQAELVLLQRSVQDENRRIAILFEGRDASGKGGTIRRFIEHLNPRSMRVVALPKPTSNEKGQWYFQRYTQHLPNPGEIVFFDRSWYNRAVVEPVNGFCTETEYKVFMQQVPEFEHMLLEDNLELIKFWFSISKDTQVKRFKSRKTNPLKQWKVSSVDERAQELWDEYTDFKKKMFARTHTSLSPWIIVKADIKKRARLESIRYVLSTLPYNHKGRTGVNLLPDPNVILRYHRTFQNLD